VARAMDGQDGQWAVVALPGDTLRDEQCLVNGYSQMVTYPSGATLPMVPVPARFDEEPPQLAPAPTLGEHTDEVLGALGKTEAQVMELRISGVVA
jgi:crotonobetainyl-CoA:carnitine CoA-transferase CaiB-like acyl-CoA transferase